MNGIMGFVQVVNATGDKGKLFTLLRGSLLYSSNKYEGRSPFDEKFRFQIQNFQWPMEQQFFVASGKDGNVARYTERNVQKFLTANFRSLDFPPGLPELSVEWFAFQKFNIFRPISGALSI